MDDLLILTNGTSAVDAIRESGIEAHFCPWNDVLHDGPVPAVPVPELARVRARFVAGRGWGDEREVLDWFEERDARLDAAPNFREVVLWFEHDLYDQLQLLQILGRLGRMSAAVSLLQADDYIAHQPFSALRESFEARRPVTEDQFRVASEGWQAFTATEPHLAHEFARQVGSGDFPHLERAFRRWFETFPDEKSGLSRTERSVLARIEAGLTSAVDLFRATSDEEEAMFRGDGSFFALVAGLAADRSPLVATASGRPFDPEHPAAERLHVTGTGRAVLAGEADRISLSGIDDWRGGMRLTTGRHWRWSAVGGFVDRH